MLIEKDKTNFTGYSVRLVKFERHVDIASITISGENWKNVEYSAIIHTLSELQ